MEVYGALIRAIGPVTHARMRMAALRQRCMSAGLGNVASHLATGNLSFSSALPREVLLARLHEVVRSFELNNDVVLRTAAELDAAHAHNPFPDAAADRPSQFAVCFLAGPPLATAWLAAYPGPERLQLDGLQLYVDYPGPVSKSKLPLGSIERRLGATMTARNWNTVETLTLATARLVASL